MSSIQPQMQKLLNVFENLTFEGTMLQEVSKIYVERLRIFKRSKKIELYLYSEFFVHYRVIEAIQKQFEIQYGAEFELDLQFRYGEETASNKELFLQYYLDSFMYKMSKTAPVVKVAMDGCNWELKNGTQLQIRLRGVGAYFLHKRELHRQMEGELYQAIGERVSVQFMDPSVQKDQHDEYLDKKNKVESAMVQQVMLNNPQTIVKEATPSAAEAGGEVEKTEVIRGKKFTGESISIVSIDEDTTRTIIEGQIINYDDREIKDGRMLGMFDLTDLTDSITVKFFEKKEKYGEVKGRLKKGSYIQIQGDIIYDSFNKEIVMMARDIQEAGKPIRMDMSEDKRVELHVHTKMSAMDSVVSVSEIIGRAAKWGHQAIAITDHGVLQAFPEAMDAGKKNKIKIIYGVEAYLVDDDKPIVVNSLNQSFDESYVVFDLETTGLSPLNDKITEIGAVKVVNGEVVDRFSSFVNPEKPIPYKIVELTGITDDMVKDAPKIDEILPQFLEFCTGSVLVAHNASFDTAFIKYFAKILNLPYDYTVLDTVALSRFLYTELKRHKLNLIAKHLGIELENHHRAVDDAEATAQIFLRMIEKLKSMNVESLNQLNEVAKAALDIKQLRPYHAIILAQNYVGLKNLYKLVSAAHLEYFHRKPRIPKSELSKLREGLILGSACEAGELYKGILNGQEDSELADIIDFYDYLEIQPIGNNRFLIEDGQVENEQMLKDINKRIVELGKQNGKPVVATCDVHFLDPHEEYFRRILLAALKFNDADNQPPLYFRTTPEMLKEFDYLGHDIAYEVVVENTNKIADMMENIKPIPDETFPPKIEGAEEEIATLTWNKVKDLYEHKGEIPEIVRLRAEKELNSIIKNGFSVMYIIAQKLVWKSLEDGYLVGSRGSVGSSFVATMTEITEVNPLPAHYVCPSCKFSEWPEGLAGKSGCDMPDKYCPECGALYHKDGHDIPFETFLGFDGDKEPDIDLNFSGEYQANAHKYTEVLFGKGYTFKAGTIGTMAEKTAYGFVKKYLDEREITVRNAEINRLVAGVTGVKRTSGQHPGGIMVVPADNEIFNFCPIQRPADDVNSEITTTHFDYHSISGRLLKLDILGHDDPTVIRMLQDITGVDPQTIPLGDPKVMSLFTTTEALGVTEEDIFTPVGALGLPEFGTKFVRQMLEDTKPTTFSELIQISGLSHGTDVWLNNAQDLIKAGICELKDTICTRDDIMTYLIDKGVPPKTAFFIMEKVRKGKGLTEDDVVVMNNQNIPQWYIDSCNKIKYMFPKAHAAAYVMMAVRIAYFKVYYPQAYYTAYFTVRADDFDYEMMCNGREKVRKFIDEYYKKGNGISTKEKNVLTILEVVNEMYSRGFNFVPLDLYKSHAKKFQITDKGLLPPFNSLQGLGDSVAENMMTAREDGEFMSIEEFRKRTKASKTIIELLKSIGCLQGIPETDQLSLF